jgi:hypothetical protein
MKRKQSEERKNSVANGYKKKIGMEKKECNNIEEKVK